MSTPIRYGFIIGGIGLILNTIISAFIGFCGPVFTIMAGALAGFFAARQYTADGTMTPTRAGAIAGAVTGGLMLFGQVFGSVLALLLIQSTNTTPIFGTLPTTPEEQIGFYIGGIGIGLCFGVVGLVMALGAGAGIGALHKPKQPEPLQPPSSF